MSKSEDRKICEAASDGPWKQSEESSHIIVKDYTEIGHGDGFLIGSLVGRDDSGFYADEAEGAANAVYMAHFNPAKLLQMLDESDAKDKRIKEVQDALLELMKEHEVPMSDYYKDLLNG